MESCPESLVASNLTLLNPSPQEWLRFHLFLKISSIFWQRKHYPYEYSYLSKYSQGSVFRYKYEIYIYYK